MKKGNGGNGDQKSPEFPQNISNIIFEFIMYPNLQGL